MLSEGIKLLWFNQYQKSNKAPFNIYEDVECLIEKIDGCKNDLQNYIFHQVFQCLKYHHLKALKIKMMCTEVKIVWKSFVNL